MGRDVETFGKLQNKNVPLKYIDSVKCERQNSLCLAAVNLNDGWSDLFSGGLNDTSSNAVAFKLHVSENGEVRPINKVVRIWKRTN